MLNENALRMFLLETNERAQGFIKADHVSADIKNCMKDLLKICDNYQGLMDHMNNSNVDSRLAKKKLEQAKVESRELENTLEDLKKTIVGLASEIKTASAEANAIIKRHANSPEDPDSISAKTVLASAQAMVKVIVNLSTSK